MSRRTFENALPVGLADRTLSGCTDPDAEAESSGKLFSRLPLPTASRILGARWEVERPVVSMMRNSKGGRPQNGNVIANNLKTLRERREFLQKEIPKLLFSGCQPGKGGRTVQVSALSPDERKLIADYQQEIKDIDATLRAFAT